ncbi:hypothetical protein [Cellulosimicrobium sp. NPDC057127]|uniref:hypothetical protein n=1 Tax=Cellulosimicrobium sp. NPDC057127 TaxID=3346026 RepID=UPI0036416631
MRALRVTRGAWARAVGLAGGRVDAGAAVVDGTGADEAVLAELREHGIADETGVLTAAWAAALRDHLAAPVRATLRARSGETGATTRLTLVEDRVLLVHDAVRGELGSRELEVTDVSAHVDVVLVRVDDLWPALVRLLPPSEPLTAGARPGPRPADLPRTVLGSRDVERLRAGEDLAALPAAARAVAEDEEASLVVLVEAWPTPATPTVVWSRWWSVAGGRLLDVQLRDDDVHLVERPPGSVAAELRWALVGAVDTTAPVADGSATTTGGAR